MINQYMEAAPSPFQVVFPNLESLHHPPLNANGSTTKWRADDCCYRMLPGPCLAKCFTSKLLSIFTKTHSFQWNPEVRFQPSKSVLCLPSVSHCSRGLSFDSPAIKSIFAYQTSFFVRTKVIMSIFHLKHITPTQIKKTWHSEGIKVTTTFPPFPRCKWVTVVAQDLDVKGLHQHTTTETCLDLLLKAPLEKGAKKILEVCICRLFFCSCIKIYIFLPGRPTVIYIIIAYIHTQIYHLYGGHIQNTKKKNIQK